MPAPTNCGYVVASWQLADELNKHTARLNTEFQAMDKNQNPICGQSGEADDEGWLTLIALRMELYRPCTSADSYKRWLYRVLKGESVSADADMADAALLACEQRIDSDTNIETHPYSLDKAVIMVTEEALFLGVELTDEEIRVLSQWKVDHRDNVIYAKGVSARHILTTRKRMERHQRVKALRQAA